MSKTRFAVIETASINGSFRNAVDGRLVPAVTPRWVRRIGTSRARSTYGTRVVKTTGDLAKALTWATRASAEAKAADLTTDYATYEARPVEVVETYPYDFPEVAIRHASEVRGAVRRDGDSWVVLREQPAEVIERVNEHTHTRPVPEGTTTGISGVQFRAVLVETSNPYLAERLPVAGYVRINEFDVHGGVQPSGAMFMPDVAEGELTSFVHVPDARFEFTTRPVVRG